MRAVEKAASAETEGVSRRRRAQAGREGLRVSGMAKMSRNSLNKSLNLLEPAMKQVRITKIGDARQTRAKRSS